MRPKPLSRKLIGQFSLVAAAFLLGGACRAPMPAESVALFRRFGGGFGEGWSDADLRAYACDVWRYVEREPDRWVQANALMWVADACYLAGSADVAAAVRAETVGRLVPILAGDLAGWRRLLIHLHHTFRSGGELRIEADRRLDLLRELEAVAPDANARAVLVRLRFGMYRDLDKEGLLRNDEERAAMVALFEELQRRRGDFDSFWARGFDGLVEHARIQLFETRVGERPPPLVGETLAGDTFDLASTRGKVTLVRFWGFW